ncbi:thioesterase [Paramagnetospirillum marisnigri]|uniref:Thioesterase n=1 Tax=Paramagnetospirillum marisnigri TaxID=1285242 RepID=A0A178MJD7_9PROT|nr:acyl-CoA thioesterase [Paramagnetospirillum marisnigri]OAN48165.1 thioesterase [Paramagnetospirillum marisnigri]
MPRVTIEIPPDFQFATEITICIGQINYGHHLDNAALLSLVSEARVRFLKSLGYGELDVEGLGIIVADAAIRYRSEAFHGEILVFEMAAADLNKYGCDLVWRARAKEDGREVAQGKTGILFFDYAARKPAPAPPEFLRKTGLA